MCLLTSNLGMLTWGEEAAGEADPCGARVETVPGSNKDTGEEKHTPHRGCGTGLSTWSGGTSGLVSTASHRSRPRTRALSNSSA